jgi:hypothetical protein
MPSCSTGNLGRFEPGKTGHNVRVAPFIEFPAQGGLPLFNATSAFLFFEVAGKLPSMAACVMPGGHVNVIALPTCVRV